MAQIYEVDVFKVDGGFFLVQPKTGMAAVCCSYYHEINGLYYWTHHGCKSIYHFIGELSKQYVLEKLFHYQDLTEFDEDQTRKNIKEYIVRRRYECIYTAAESRELWNNLELCETPEDVMRLNIPDVWEMMNYIYKPCVNFFWKEMWPKLVEAAKQKAAEIDLRDGQKLVA